MTLTDADIAAILDAVPRLCLCDLRAIERAGFVVSRGVISNVDAPRPTKPSGHTQN